MGAIIHIDKPNRSFLLNINQDIVGWFACHKGVPYNLSFKVSDVNCWATLCSRPDVEHALNAGGANVMQVTGWLVRVDKEALYKTSGRTVTLKIFNGDDVVYEKIFYKCASLRTEIDSSPLIFMHVPKTGGTALRQYIDFAFAEWPILNIYEDYPGVKALEIHKLDAKFLASREIVFGHFYYHFDELITTKTSKYFVVMRQPGELVNSYVNFTTNYDLNLLDNPLVRYISGNYGKVSYGGLTDAHLDCAIKNIESQFYVIHADKLQEFADELSDLLGLKRMTIPRINEGTYKPGNAQPPVSPLVYLDERLFEHSLGLDQNLKHFLTGGVLTELY